MNITLLSLFISIFSVQSFAQAQVPVIPPAAPAVDAPAGVAEEGVEKPNGRRIRRQLNLILGVEHDEELLIPMREIVIKGAGASENFDIKRIKGTDYFRILPKKAANGIATINDQKTGQILVELRYDIRDGVIEKQNRELQALLGDIEGIEYKMVNGKILLDGYVLLSRDLIRIANVVKQFSDVKSLVTLSPIARKKIVEYIARDVNNPEVSITSVGDFIKLEGIVNSKEERARIKTIVQLYMPDLVTDVAAEGVLEGVKITGRKAGGSIDSFIIDLLDERKNEEKTEPPPKMIQVVVHFVQFIENYGKSFLFKFEPSFAAGATSAGSVNDTFNLISRLAPKLQWAKSHGYARVLDTASILTQDKKKGVYENKITIFGPPVAASSAPGAAPAAPNNIIATVKIDVTPTIKSERSGLIELPLSVNVDDTDSKKTTTNSVNTVISVRDRQSAAFAGIIKKKGSNEFGGSPGVEDAIVSFKSGKKYDKSSSNFVVFVTPIIKSSASAGVDQVKKKFRLRE